MRFVKFKDGTLKRMAVYVYDGACLTGDPTAYVNRDGKLTWVLPFGGGWFVEA